MHIQVNTDNNITGREELTEFVKTELEAKLGRFSERITRLEVHLGDENSHKESTDDKRCMLEARVNGLQPIAVTHIADTLHQALIGASEKMKKSLDSTLEKLRGY